MLPTSTFVRAFELHAGARNQEMRRFQNLLRIEGGETLRGLVSKLKAVFPDSSGRIDDIIAKIIQANNFKPNFIGVWSGADLSAIQLETVRELTKSPFADDWWTAKNVFVDSREFISKTQDALVSGALDGGWFMWNFIPKNGKILTRIVGMADAGAIVEPDEPEYAKLRDGNDVKMRLPFHMANVEDQAKSFECLVTTIMEFLENNENPPMFSFKMAVGSRSRGQCGKELDFICSNLDSLGRFLAYLKNEKECVVPAPKCDMPLLRYAFQPGVLEAKQQIMEQYQSRMEKQLRVVQLKEFLKNMKRNKFEFQLVKLPTGEWVTFRNERISAVTLELDQNIFTNLGLEGTIGMLGKCINGGFAIYDLYRQIIDIFLARLDPHSEVTGPTAYFESMQDYQDTLNAVRPALETLKEHADFFYFPVTQELEALQKLL